MKTFVGICGTTCVGKSEVAVHLAKMMKSVVLSADSMQIYQGMDIGTAKITASDTCGVRHFMLDVVPPCEEYSSFDYQAAASKIIDNCETVPIVVGGTGFYFDSLLYPPEYGSPDKSRRIQLQSILQTQGLEALCDILRRVDSRAYSTVDIKNPVRVMRAIEIAESGGSRSQGKGKRDKRYNARIYLLQRDRQSLYNMIDARVIKMISAGLVDEVKSLVQKFGVCDTSAFSAIGYKEIINYLQGGCTLEEAVEQIKINTRHYAKRQITYFKKMDIALTVDVDGMTSEQVAKEIYLDLQNNGIV